MTRRSGRGALSLALALSLAARAVAGCGGVVPAPAEPGAPSTHRDPPRHAPPPEPAPSTGEIVGIASSAGDDQARDVLARLVIALRDQDRDALEALLAPEIHHAASLLVGRGRSTVARDRFVDQLVARARLGQLRADARLEELIDPAGVRVDPIARVVTGALPPELAPGDLVVRFELGAAGRPGLDGIAPGGQGALVIRPGEDPRVVAR